MSLIIANWKMHGDASHVASWLIDVANCLSSDNSAAQVVLCPPAVWIADAVRANPTPDTIAIGAQDCHHAQAGAYTGDIGSNMLTKLGAKYIIIGHSERRNAYGETSAIIAQKCQSVKHSGAIPIVCVGESLVERESAQAYDVVRAQITESIWKSDAPCIIAYEPVWAIGTGKTANLEDIAAMHAFIKSLSAELQLSRDRAITVVYGGSVNPSNAASILALPDVDGALVGSASLASETFCAILRSAPSKK